MEDLVNFTAILSILWQFCYLVYFSTFWYVVPKKIWQRCLHQAIILFIDRAEVAKC
jgi:hypothetical protein